MGFLEPARGILAAGSAGYFRQGDGPGSCYRGGAVQAGEPMTAQGDGGAGLWLPRPYPFPLGGDLSPFGRLCCQGQAPTGWPSASL